MKKLTVIFSFSVLSVLTGSSCAEKAPSFKLAAPQAQFDQMHSAFTAILSKQVKDGLVDYAGLKKDPASLKAFLDTLAAVPEPTFKTWKKGEQMAFLINLYNAATLKLVADHYPVKSIKDIGGAAGGPWKQKVVRFFGKVESLDHIEHDLLRPGYKDPRVHFAVNCASIGCPVLRAEAFQGSKLDAQLDEQGRIFLRDASKNRLDAGRKALHLSSIFDWFKDDFIAKSGSVEKFVLPYVSDADRKVIGKGGLTMKSTDYDWTLNRQ